MPSVIVQRREAVLEILLNRPAVLNAANREMIGELAGAAADAAEHAVSLSRAVARRRLAFLCRRRHQYVRRLDFAPARGP